MNRANIALQDQSASLLRPGQGVLQRKCGCGNQTIAGGECTECAKKKNSLQRKLAIGASNDPLEQEADRVADQVMAMPTNSNIGKAPLSIQRLTAQSTGQANTTAPASVDRVLASSGRPMEPVLRQDMEQRFGHDFSQVRVHSGVAAERSTRDINAHAYTAGNHVVFGEGQFAPSRYSGRKLLAHELTHVVQQNNTGSRVAKASTKLQRRNIFQEIGGLFASDNYDETTLQTYLSQLQLNNNIEDFTDSDNKARAIIAAWKRGGSPYTLTPQLKALLIQEMQSGFTGNDDENSILEILWRSDNVALTSIFGTISANNLNSDFHGSQWDELQVFYARRFDGGLSNILAGTITPKGTPVPFGVEIVGLRAPNSIDRSRAMEAINTEVRTSTGALPDFDRTIDGEADTWEVRVENEINTQITSMHNRMVVARPPRIAANMLDDTDINRVAGAAQSETDGVYSQYYGAKPSFVVGINIHDAFATRGATIAASISSADWAANFRVLKLLVGHENIAAINDQHGAIYTRSEEWALIAPILGFPLIPVLTMSENGRSSPHVIAGIVGSRRIELLDIHRNWPAFAGAGQINMDFMKASNDIANRHNMYDMFGTVIHEYIHTLEHPDHEGYREALGEQQGGFVLREGMTEYLTKLVWDQVDFNPAMRLVIEGGFQNLLDPNGHSIELPPRYKEWRNAEQLSNIVGLSNVRAAFFLGRVDLIGST